MFGLPLHLWREDILKKLGDRCGGFVVMDKETTHREDPRWARILVKNSNSRKPSSVNLLAGARSYELHIWWEIQPRVVEVYPQVNRTKGLLNRHSEEDEGKSRANERVRDTKGKSLHTSREMRWTRSQQKTLGLRGSSGGVLQRQMCVGIPNVRPKKCYVSQNNLGIRVRIEGETQASERVSKKGHLGLQSGRNAAQNLNHRQENCVGQSPKRYMVQAKSSPVKKDVDNQRVTRTGLSAEKTKIKEKYSLVSLQKSADIAGEEKEQQEKCLVLMSG